MVGSAPVIVASSKAASSASLKEVNSEEKPIDWWARVLAFLGILIGVFNLAFGYWKLSQDRRFSKEDDFWFRKIIAPATIEPMLKAVTSLLQDVPVKGARTDEIGQFALTITKEFVKLYPAMQTLALFDEELPAQVTDKLRICEDLLTEYSGALSSTDGDGRSNPIASVVDLRQDVLHALNGALHVIKSRHVNPSKSIAK